ncbi:MAG: VWA domain-containing protein [Planctomicrobium sp.]|jgi:hypothetical protein|nr:VWA domain-containing protein [Planctomicrobium sp.]
MTSLRFVGDLPLWWGLLLSLIVCGMSWRYYSRESFDLPRHMKWFLPLLRSTAFFLGIMMLTSPVLHHRKTIGELGKVQIFLDQSKSMSLNDRHLSAARKLKIAEELGWISKESVNTGLSELASRLSRTQSEFEQQLSNFITSLTEQPNSTEEDQQTGLTAEQTSQLKDVISKFNEQFGVIQKELPVPYGKQFKVDVLEPFTAFEKKENLMTQSIEELSALSQNVTAIKERLLEEFQSTLAANSGSGADSPTSAITQFDVTSRWRRAEIAIAESPTKVLQELQKYHDVEIFSLQGEAATILNFEDASNENQQQSSSPEISYTMETNLSSGIVANQKIDESKEGSEQAKSAQKAIVIISDGNHNSGSSPIQMARVLGQQNTQIYGVAMGAETPAADIALIGIEAPDTVFKTDRIRGAITLRDSMPAGMPFIAQISHEDKVLWQAELISQNVAERRVEFEFSVAELIEEDSILSTDDVEQLVRQLKLTAAVVPLSNESETENNFRELHLGVITESHRILILDGRSRWETRYLRNVFERDEQWTVNTIIAGLGTDEVQLPRGEQADQFPVSRDDLFEYDLIVFGEIQRDLFQEQELLWLKEFVELRGGGIIFIDGQRRTLQTYLDSEIESLIPVEWSDKTFASLPTQLQLTDIGAAETALRLQVDKQENSEFWTQLPAPHTVIPVEALAGAEVLAEAVIEENQYPAMVSRRFGAGRVLYLAFDESWRWRYKTADLWHQRIWNQIARYVIPRPFSVSDEFVSLDTGQVRYQAGATVGIRARLLGVDGKPVSDANAEALLWKDGQIVGNVHLTKDVEIPGLYRGTSTSLPAGEYEVSMRASGFSDSAFKARSQFIVEANETDELAQTSANYELLEQMSEVSGGTFLREEEISRLPELLSPLSHGRVIESETILWQSYWWFAMIIALLTLEWILRKRVGLL